MNRRELLTRAGAVGGLVGLGGYHQRRRVRRWPDRRGLVGALDIDPGDLDPPVVPPVTAAHYDDALGDLAAAVGDAEEAWTGHEFSRFPDQEAERAEVALDRAVSVLDEHEDGPDGIGSRDPTDRLAAIDDIRDALSDATHALSFARFERTEEDIAEIDEAREALEARYTDRHGDLAYAGPDPAWVAVAYAGVDERLEAVRRAILGADRELRERPYRSAANIAYGRARLDDIERFVGQLEREGGSRGTVAPQREVLADRYETMRAATDDIVSATDFAFDEEHLNHAAEVWRQPEGSFDPAGIDARDEGQLAIAILEAAELYGIALVLEAFVDHPRLLRLDPDDPLVDDIETGGSDVRAAKQAAVDAIDDRLAEDGDDPFVTDRCRALGDAVRARNWRLESTLRRINAGAAGEWTLALETHRRAYRELEERVAAVPAVAELLREE